MVLPPGGSYAHKWIYDLDREVLVQTVREALCL